MKSAFEPIVLEWGGKPYRIANDMRAIRQVERVTNRPDVLKDLIATGLLVPADIAEIFAGLLRLGGAEVTDDEVYTGLFRGGATEADQIAAAQVIGAIMASRNPPAAEGAAGEANPRQKPRRSARSGRKRSSSPSAPGA
jgi:hypothetical protein